MIYHDLANYNISIEQRELICAGSTTSTIILNEENQLINAEKSLLESEKMLYNEMKDFKPIEKPKEEDEQFLLF